MLVGTEDRSENGWRSCCVSILGGILQWLLGACHWLSGLEEAVRLHQTEALVHHVQVLQQVLRSYLYTAQALYVLSGKPTAAGNAQSGISAPSEITGDRYLFYMMGPQWGGDERLTPGS